MMDSPGEFTGHWATGFVRLGGHQASLSSAQGQFYPNLLYKRRRKAKTTKDPKHKDKKFGLPLLDFKQRLAKS